MASNELVFSLAAFAEGEFSSVWSNTDLKSSLLAFSIKLEEKLQIKTNYKTLAATGILALGVVGGLINRDVTARKSQKLVDGSTYVLIDLIAQQIACKSLLASLVDEGDRASKTRWESFCLNLKELIQSGVKIESVNGELGKYGLFLTYVVSTLSELEGSLKIRHAISGEIASMAA